jgi:hypothetical protein
MQLRLFADYFQLVLTDESSESSLETHWTDQTLPDRIESRSWGRPVGYGPR